MADVKNLVNKWTSDEKFRNELRSNPEQTIKNAGYDVNSPEAKKALNTIHSMNDDQIKKKLEERETKWWI